MSWSCFWENQQKWMTFVCNFMRTNMKYKSEVGNCPNALIFNYKSVFLARPNKCFCLHNIKGRITEFIFCIILIKLFRLIDKYIDDDFMLGFFMWYLFFHTSISVSFIANPAGTLSIKYRLLTLSWRLW